MALIDTSGLARFLVRLKEIFFLKSGGTISGDTNVAGVLRVQSQQAFYYAASTKTQTIGTNNATGGTTVACGSSANMTLNGANVKGPNLLPKASNTHTLGTTSLRWKGIYSNEAVNVASDERLKRNIDNVHPADLAEFVKGLNVVMYNYKDDPDGARARIGLIAQQVQAVDPVIAKYFVGEDAEGMLSLRPADLVFPLIAAVQQLSAKVDELSKN